MIDLDAAKTPAGLTCEDLAALARECYLRITQQPVTDWGSIPEGKQENWRDAASVVLIHYILETEVSWQQLTAKVMEKYLGVNSWDREPPMIKIVWEAVSRHIANLISAEDGSEVDEAKSEDWHEWILNKIEKEK